MSDPVIEVRGRVEVPYRWSYGRSLGRFFIETRDAKRLWGARCLGCSAVIVPPVSLCGRCFRETEREWVPIADRGVLDTWTTVFLPFPGQPTEPPYTFGLIKLDGADTHFAHLVREIDPKDLRRGMRVEAVWSEERKGDLYDIAHFRPEPRVTASPDHR